MSRPCCPCPHYRWQCTFRSWPFDVLWWASHNILYLATCRWCNFNACSGEYFHFAIFIFLPPLKHSLSCHDAVQDLHCFIYIVLLYHHCPGYPLKLKRLIVISKTLSRVSWITIWNQAFTWFFMYRLRGDVRNMFNCLYIFWKQITGKSYEILVAICRLLMYLITWLASINIIN